MRWLMDTSLMTVGHTSGQFQRTYGAQRYKKLEES
jgi:hypothetical protein